MKNIMYGKQYNISKAFGLVKDNLDIILLKSDNCFIYLSSRNVDMAKTWIEHIMEKYFSRNLSTIVIKKTETNCIQIITNDRNLIYDINAQLKKEYSWKFGIISNEEAIQLILNYS